MTNEEQNPEQPFNVGRTYVNKRFALAGLHVRANAMEDQLVAFDHSLTEAEAEITELKERIADLEKQLKEKGQ